MSSPNKKNRRSGGRKDQIQNDKEHQPMEVEEPVVNDDDDANDFDDEEGMNVVHVVMILSYKINFVI